MTRVRAFTVHLAISIVIAAVVVLAMYFLWYPTPYFQAMGGGLLLALIVGVDVIIGPMITLFIFDLQKKSLKFDLAFIAVVQLAALLYGAMTMFQARPAYVVYYKDRFDVVVPARIPESELKRARGTPYQALPIAGPELVALNLPDDKKEIDRMSSQSEAALDFVAFPQHYVPYEQKAKLAGLASKSLSELKQKNQQLERVNVELTELLRKADISESKAGYLPLNTKANDMAVILERENGKILGMIFANPW
jgi:hypothetical protein